MKAVSFSRWVGCILFLAMAACHAPPKPCDADEIRLGMHKEQVAARMGRPAEKKGPVAGARGRMQETWFYEIDRDVDSSGEVAVGVLTSGVGFFEDPTRRNRLQFDFVDDRLVRWGETAAAPARPGR